MSAHAHPSKIEEYADYSPGVQTKWAQDMAYWKFDLNEAIQFLNQDFPIRKIDEELQKVIEFKAKKRKISEKDVILEFEKEMGVDNLERLDEWIKEGKLNNSSDKGRDYAIRIAFALKMTYEETETFLKMCWYDGFYMRDYKDVIYRHCLNDNKMSYKDAEKMIKDLSNIDKPNYDIDERAIGVGSATVFLDIGTKAILSGKKLKKYIEDNSKYFGSFRRKAYERFMEMCDQINEELNERYVENKEEYKKMNEKWDKNAEDIVDEIPEIIVRMIAENIAEENRITIEEAKEEAKVIVKAKSIAEVKELAYETYKAAYKNNIIGKDITYDAWININAQQYRGNKISGRELCAAIVKGIPEMRERGLGNVIKEAIVEYIPTRTTLGGIIKKTERDGKITKVNKKLLLLVWLSTADGDTEIFKTGHTVKDLTEHLKVIDEGLLKPYGMAALDPRHPFDWIIMNSLYCAYLLYEKDIDKHRYVAIDNIISTAETRMHDLINRMSK